MSAAPDGGSPLVDTDFADLVRQAGADVAGSLYAVSDRHRPAAAQLLTRHRLWVHADVFPDTTAGVSVDLIRSVAAAQRGPLDVHLLTDESMAALPDVCVPGVTRITFPWEETDVAAVAAQVRAAGARPWLAVAPATPLDDCRHALADVDGLLVMLIQPGTRDPADLQQLHKVSAATRQGHPVGVDGGVHRANLSAVLDAGATYVVAGRQLFPDPTHTTDTSERQP